MIPYLPKQLIFDKLSYSLNFKFSECDIKEIRPFLFIDDEFAPNYGKNGIYNTIPLLAQFRKRELFQDEFSKMIRLVLATCNYLHDYCSFIDIDLSCVAAPPEFTEISPIFHKQILKIFESEISEIIKADKEERNSLPKEEFNENSLTGSMMIDALMSIYKDKTGKYLSRDKVIEMLKKNN